MPNRLVASLGTAWNIIPGLFAFTNPGELDLYDHHPKHAEICELRRTWFASQLAAAKIPPQRGGIRQPGVTTMPLT